MDFNTLAGSCLRLIRDKETEFIEKKTLEEKVEFVKENLESNALDVASIVRKWRKEPQFHKDLLKSKEMREKGDKMYCNKEVDKAAQLYRFVRSKIREWGGLCAVIFFSNISSRATSIC